MPKINDEQAKAAFLKYQNENVGSAQTRMDIFTRWLESDEGAFARYVGGNLGTTTILSLQEFATGFGLAAIQNDAVLVDSALTTSQSGAAHHGVVTSALPHLQQNAVTELAELKREVVFQKALRDASILLRNHGATNKSAFISYAWEDEATAEGKVANERLQSWLKKLVKDLEAVGVKVFLDIEGMQGKMSGWMESSIEKSDHILLIGTPRYKIRASQETNVAFEFKCILKKLETSKHANVLLPLLYSGDFESSFPAGVTEYLIRDFRQMEKYYNYLLGIAKPLGLVPNIYPEIQKEGPYYQEYTWLFELFANQLNSLEAQIRSLKDSTLPPVADELPTASPYFVGRSQELAMLASGFQRKGLVTMAIQGMGGSGKSQLAAEYAHGNKIGDKPYSLTRWLKADSEENLKTSYYSLGNDLGVDRNDFKDSEVNLRKAIQTQLLRYENILLIYDNVESLDYLASYQPSAGGNVNVHMLITTRNRFVDFPSLEVKEFTAMEIREYLNKRLTKDVSQAIAEQLGQELGYLPLAVVQAGSYMVKYAKTPESFLKLLQGEGRQRVLEKEIDPKLKTIATLWSMTLEKLSPQALEVIRFCSYLNADNIPQNLLEQMLPENMQDDVLYELRSQSLLIEASSEGQLFRIHRLLQEAVRLQLLRQDSSGAIATAILEKGVEALKCIIGSYETMDKIRRHTEITMFWKDQNYLYLQVMNLIKEGEKLKISEALLATLLEWAGWRQSVIAANLDESLALFNKSLKIKKSHYGENHQSVAYSLICVGDNYSTRDQFDESLKHYEQALTIHKTIYGDNHQEVAGSLINVGDACAFQHRYREGEGYYLQSLNVYKDIYGENHQKVADALVKLAFVYESMGQVSEALKCYQQALVMVRGLYGDRHVEVAPILYSYGNFNEMLQQNDKALECYEQSLEIEKAHRGAAHPYVAHNLTKLGCVYKDLGQYDMALKYHEQSLAIRKMVYGNNHSRIAGSLSDIGDVYAARGQYEEALKHHEQSLAIRKVVYGNNHSRIAESFISIGDVYAARGQYDKALEYVQQSLAIYVDLYGDKSPDVATCLNDIGNIHKAQSQYNDALENYQQALVIRKAIHGENHPDVTLILSNIISVNEKLQKSSTLLFSETSEPATKKAKPAHDDVDATQAQFRPST